MTNPICNNCANLGINCNGTECQSWTGCIHRKISIKEGDDVLVHIYDTNGKEIITKNYEKHYVVYNKCGKLGIKWNTERRPYMCDGEEFAPFDTFAPSVIFERIADGARFHYSTITEKVVLKA